jgi:hypothetical protein
MGLGVMESLVYLLRLQRTSRARRSLGQIDCFPRPRQHVRNGRESLLRAPSRSLYPVNIIQRVFAQLPVYANAREVAKPGAASASASNGCLLARSNAREPAPSWSTPAAEIRRAGEFPLMLSSGEMPSWLGKKCRPSMCLTLATQRGNNRANCSRNDPFRTGILENPWTIN